MTSPDAINAPPTQRRIVKRTRGQGGGPITRLMSPSDLGETLKPFVFLDIINMDDSTFNEIGEMPLHPHSGIATVTVFTEGHMRYDDPASGSGIIGYGGVEWMRAGGGVWHGKEMSPGQVERLQGFQLWLSLPPYLESSEPESRFVEAKDMVRAGPAYVIVGEHEGSQSPLPAPAGISYLLVTLQPGESWTHSPPSGHGVGWLALANGQLSADTSIFAGEMVIFEQGDSPISLEVSSDQKAIFVLGSAVPHPYPLHLGRYSVHTSAQSRADGERCISELDRKLKEGGDRHTASGTIPVFR